MGRKNMKHFDLIFDIDGTLWDSCEAVCESWRLSLRRRYGCFGSPDLSQVRSIMGMTPDEIAEKLFSRFGSHAREVFDALSEDECAYLREHGAAIYPAVEETLRQLASSRRLFLVSNCQAGYIDAFLTASGLGELFSDSLCAGVSGKGKSENIRTLREKHTITQAIYIGDTRADESAARETDCRFIHAAYGFGEADAADAVACSFAELPALVRELEREDTAHA